MPRNGFTLVELVVVMLILALFASVAVPGFADMAARNRVAADLNALNASLQQARSEAVRRGRDTVICPSQDGRHCVSNGTWEHGWLAFVDLDGDDACAASSDRSCADGGAILHVSGPLDSGTLRATGRLRERVAYTALGTADGYLGSFHRCSADGETRAGMTLIMTGRLRRKAEADVVCP